MEALVKALLAWVAAYPGWAYLVVFLSAAAESLAVIGMLVPGVVILLGAGALIATGSLAFWPTCLAAIGGAVAGDGLSYWLGRHYRGRIRRFWPFSRYPQQLERGIAFCERFGIRSVMFGRFFGPGRAVIPLVAGMLEMPPRRFLIANISSAMAWGPAYLAPGIVFGASLKLAAEAATRLALLLVLLVGLLWLSVWAAHRLYRLLSPHASAWVRDILRWADVHPTVGRLAQALADPGHPDAATLTALAALLLGATGVLGISIGAGLFGAQYLMVNQFTLDLGQSLHTPLADHLMAGLNRLGTTTLLLPLTLVLFTYLTRSDQGREANYWLAAMSFAVVATPTLGLLLRVQRPDLGLLLTWPWSFPSAPVLAATVAYGFLAVLLSHGGSPRWRWLPYAMAAVLIVGVASARLYFGTEWLTDVVGSAALGLAWIAALGLALRRHTRDTPHRAALGAILLLTGFVAFGLGSLYRHPVDLAAFTPGRPPCYVDAKAWQQRADLPIATHRQDLWQRSERPFDVQYAGPLAALAQALTQAGWQPAPMLGWDNAIKLLSPSLPITDLPVVPHVHDGHHEALTMVRDQGPDQRLVLRLWAAECRISADIPLWIGNVTRLGKDRILDLLALPITRPLTAAGRATLAGDLARSPAIALDPGDPLLLAAPATVLLPAAPGIDSAPSPTTPPVRPPATR
ncbi:MAG: phosphatase PAP2 family protein [Chromatiaceae bacterium]|nr:MAG: phosphatase PAP2 family protein [Chromatiaceae bacterium]